MPVVAKSFQLTPDQVGWCIIASTASTIFARLLFGWLSDRIGPRLAYTWLLVVGSLAVMGIGLSRDYTTSFLPPDDRRHSGASFVITRYQHDHDVCSRLHGTCERRDGRLGNLGGGATPSADAGRVRTACRAARARASRCGWRLAMAVAGGLCLLMAIASVA